MPSGPSIILHAVGFSASDGEIARKAGCCVNMEYNDEHGRKSTRVITHPIGDASEDRAHLQAAHLALASISRSMRRSVRVQLFCPMVVKTALDVADPCYSETHEIDADVIGEVRKWATFYDKLRFATCVVHKMMGVDLAGKCAESQSGSDTGTVVVNG